MDRHGPFFRSRLDGEVYDLGGRFIIGEDLAVLHRLAHHAVQRLDSVGGADHPADVVRVFEQGDQVVPVFEPALADDKETVTSTFSKGVQFTFCFLGVERGINFSGQQPQPYALSRRQTSTSYAPCARCTAEFWF